MGVNSGTFHTARPHKMLGFDVTINVAATMITDAGKTYDFYIPPSNVDIPIDVSGVGSYTVTLNLDDVYESDRTSSTLFGEKTSHDITVDEAAASAAIYGSLAQQSGLSQDQIQSLVPASTISGLLTDYVPTIKTPQGFNLPAFPMVMPQASIGLPMSIELSVRGFPKMPAGDLGDLSFFGFGGKIGLNQFIPIPNLVLPRVSVGYYYTNLDLGSIISVKNSISTLQISKSIPFLTVYGGVGLESSSMDVSYDYQYTDPATQETSTDNVSFTMDGKNTFRTIVGVRLKLAILSINADYNMGEFNTANIGVGLTLR
ncbi:MAG: hypothetical protein D6762_08160 [Candidatus Neomarinimicrobiota bacterium]|nr:MAG: hypothetical protein D6762_08160 [Candidatus Neomarinimicrobiota bacterium]